MEKTRQTLGANIAKFRKLKNLTQGELACKLGVSFQAVSKWETAISTPAVSYLPIIADTLSCSVDDLFSRPRHDAAFSCRLCTELPWDDDQTVRGVLYLGRKLLQVAERDERIAFEIYGDAKQVQCAGDLTVNGNVLGDASALSIKTSGDIFGNCSTSALNCRYVKAEKISGCVAACESIECNTVIGALTCKSIKCKKIEGSVTIKHEKG